MTDNSRTKSRKPVPQPHGGALIPGRGRGPRKGASNAGRPPEAWKDEIRALRDGWLEAARLHRIVDDPAHPAWFKFGAFLHEQLEGKAKYRVDVGEKRLTLEDLVAGSFRDSDTP